MAMDGVDPLVTTLFPINANISSYTTPTAPSSGPNGTVLAFQNLVPAIVECFTIILFGYVAGRTQIVQPSQAKGLGNYVTYFALPAIVFKSLVELEFSEVNWLFWASVLIAKGIVFVIVYVGTLLLSGLGSLGKAGLYSMFATQSNDFAIGYPIVKALYSNSYPELINYIYILAPVNLLFLNPWAFLSLEVKKSSQTEGRRKNILVAWSVLKGLIMNPVFTSVLLGTIFNFVFSQKLPPTLGNVFTTLANSFSPTALFLLGVNMVGKVKQQKGLMLVTPALLIAAKLLVLPLVTNQLVYALDPGRGNATVTDTYASFGFLYGSIPTAPTVFLYATHYQESVNMMAPTMVYCTFISAPFMFITATMMMIPMATESQYHSALADGAFDVSCIGLASAVWVFIIFLLRRRMSQFPHQFTANLIVAQALAAVAVILCHSVHFTAYWAKLLHFILLLTGVYGARCWTAMVALSLFLLRYRSTCFVVRHRFFFYLYGWGIPLFTIGILIAVMPLDPSVDVLYEIENQQLIASVVILVLNIGMSLVPLVALHRLDRFKRDVSYQRLPGYDSSESESEAVRTTVSLTQNGIVPDKCTNNSNVSPCSSNSDLDSPSSSTAPLTDIEDLPTLNESIQRQMCGARFGCSRYRANECRRLLLRRNLREMRQLEEEEGEVVWDEAKRHQLGRHIILLYLLILSMIIALSLCLWKLLGVTQSGIFLELSFLDCILNFGQGFIVLAIFGFDTENVIMPIVRLTRKWRKPIFRSVRKCIYGTEKVRLPRLDDLSPEVLHTCEQFNTHHLARCTDVIVTDLKYHLRTYKNVYRGSDLVDWLLEVGLAEGRIEASTYASRLLLGRVLEHCHNEHHFHDNGLFYRFVVDEDEEEGGGQSEQNGNVKEDDVPDEMIDEVDSRTCVRT